MTSLSQDIKDKLTRLNVLEKIIAVNLAIFLLGLIYKPALSWIELPSNFGEFIFQPWSIISYAFVHHDFLHILFNMLWLYIIAQWMLNLFSQKMALTIYFLGAISGAVLYLLVYNLFPDLFGRSRLIGASASVRALLIFLCAYMPNREFRFFVINLKLWYLGLALVIFDILGIFGPNTGGNLAHLGGALLGYFYAKQLLKGQDIGSGFGKFMDGIANMFETPKRKPLKTVHKNKNKVGGFQRAEFNQFNDQKKIDVILDKISKSGYDSLTSEEKEFLFRAGK